MSKIAVIYWSGTGNTEAMANLIADAAKAAGAEVDCLSVANAPAALSAYNAVALGCPAMGSEELEDSEFEPYYQSIRGGLTAKPVVLFGSYGWGDGEWIRNWADDAQAAGAAMVVDPVTANDAPDADAAEACAAAGKALANA